MTKKKEVRKNKTHVMHGLSKSIVYRRHSSLVRKMPVLPICDRCRDSQNGFLNFLEDMGHPPVGYSLILKVGANVYGPGNCLWGSRPVRVMPVDLLIENDFTEKQGGVYQLTFSNGTFYIGGTTNFKIRIQTYKTEMKDGYAHNKRMKKAIEESNSVRFSILELVDDKKEVKVREDYYLKQNKDNTSMLNRSVNAFSNKGCRWTPEERMKMSLATKGIPRLGRPRRTSPIRHVKKGPKRIRIMAFDRNGNELGQFISIMAAASHFSVNNGSISKVLNGKVSHTGGIIFKKT